jgi:hypothetical protein
MALESPVVSTPRRELTPMESAFNILVFVLFAGLWAVFAFALIASQGSLDAAWQWIRDLPLLLQGVVWLLFLPVVLGLWIWESGWPFLLRLLLVGGIGFWNVYLFFPRYLFGR